ncbi:alpha/beta hydrolase [Paenibacillus sp. FSL R7-0272]|uniref:alpha/beta hydrolase n=1 Tax=Paenibacillus sp. FSL R7-0272 TaxID=2921679 RepID=UPI0030EC098A
MDFINRVAPELRAGLLGLEVIQLPEDLMRARTNADPNVSQVDQTSDAVQIVNEYIQGSDGNELQLRIYSPVHENTQERPALLWIHGGGMILGSPEGDDQLCTDFAIRADCIVVSPNYRLAPEHPYPAGLEDCYNTLQWMSEEAEARGIDLKRIAVGGASAGGGLAVALTLLTRDRKGPELCFQLPLYPMLDHRNGTSSSYEMTHPSIWNRAHNVAAWKMYLGHQFNIEVPVYASPSLATDLTGLPPAYICVGELDLFRDEILEYVSRLSRAGVKVEFHLYPGCYHASEHVAPEAESSQLIRTEYIERLAQALKREPERTTSDF